MLLTSGNKITRLVAVSSALTLSFSSLSPTFAQDESANGEFTRNSSYVLTSDGTRLAMDIYRPAATDDAKLPVVLTMTPYQRARRGPNGEIAVDPTTRYLLSRGYAVAIGDLRGKGASFGTRGVPAGEQETADIGDMIEYLGAQSWTNGKVGMHGCSYVGMTVMAGVASNAPHLKAAAVNSTQYDLMGIFTEGGGFRGQPMPDERAGVDAEIATAVPVDTDPDGTIKASARAERMDNLSFLELTRSVPFRDSVSELTGESYWDRYSFYARKDAVERNDVPIFFISSWYDPFANDTVLAYNNFENAEQLHMGHGQHCQSPDYDLDKAMADFFDRHLMDEPAPAAASPVTYYLENGTGGHEWISADAFPPAGVERTTMHLTVGEDGAGKLGKDSARTASAVTSLSSSGEDIMIKFGVPRANADPFSANFTSAPFTEATVLAGIPSITVTMAAPDTEYRTVAYLSVIDNYGFPDVVSNGKLTASRRILGDAPFDAMGLPFPTYNEADYAPLTANETVEMSFALSAIGRVIHPGQRLRLSIAAAPREDGSRAPVTVKTGPGIAATLELPLMPFEDRR